MTEEAQVAESICPAPSPAGTSVMTVPTPFPCCGALWQRGGEEGERADVTRFAERDMAEIEPNTEALLTSQTS